MDKKQDIKLKMLENNLEHKKYVFDIFVKVLARYKITDMSYGAIMWEEQWYKNISNSLKKYSDQLFDSLSSGNEIKDTEDSIKYYDELIEMCKGKIRELGEDQKIQIVKDSLSHERLAMQTWDFKKLERGVKKCLQTKS